MATLPLLYGSLLFFVLSVFVLYRRISAKDGGKEREKRAQVLVLGDIARSPRMRNHSTSLASHKVLVDLIGYVGMSRD